MDRLALDRAVPYSLTRYLKQATARVDGHDYIGQLSTFKQLIAASSHAGNLATAPETAGARATAVGPALSSRQSSQNYPRLQPLRRQIAIVGQALTAFPRVPSSEAFERRPP